MPRFERRTENAEVGALSTVLPDVAFTKGGVRFDPREDLWEWKDGPFKVYIDYTRVKGPYIELRRPLKTCLLVFATGYSPSHLTNLWGVFLHFIAQRGDSLTSISAQDIGNYAAGLREHEQWRLATFNVLIQKWCALRLEGMDAECAQYLRERRKGGNRKGDAVRTRDPENGPFSEAEYTALYKEVDAQYGMGHIPMWSTVLTRLLFACGGRISQYAALKIMDLQTSVAGDGRASFVLQLPQAKTRAKNSRVHMKAFDLSPQTGRMVCEYIDHLRQAGFDEASALFPEEVVLSLDRTEESFEDSPRDLFLGHSTAQQLASRFVNVLGPIAPRTERLEFEPLPIATKRFRYTFGTRMAEEGASKAVMADRLGHVDLQNVDVYFEASPIIVDNIDKAMDAYLAPLARAFKGRLIGDERDSTHKGAPGSRIIDFRVSMAPVGSCGGKGAGCEFNKPVACYTCFKFEPWLDAPHEKILQRLREERKRIGDDRVARVNDDAIRAVIEVMAECDQVRAQKVAEA